MSPAPVPLTSRMLTTPGPAVVPIPRRGQTLPAMADLSDMTVCAARSMMELLAIVHLARTTVSLQKIVMF